MVSMIFCSMLGKGLNASLGNGEKRPFAPPTKKMTQDIKTRAEAILEKSSDIIPLKRAIKPVNTCVNAASPPTTNGKTEIRRDDIAIGGIIGPGCSEAKTSRSP